jgi:hypothetical protein
VLTEQAQLSLRFFSSSRRKRTQGEKELFNSLSPRTTMARKNVYGVLFTSESSGDDEKSFLKNSCHAIPLIQGDEREKSSSSAIPEASKKS